MKKGELVDLSLRELQAQLPALLTFECVAQHMNFAKAASDLRVTPTAVSKTIKQLEAQMNTRLFNRNTRSVALTGSGALEVILEKFSLPRGTFNIYYANRRQISGKLRVFIDHIKAAHWILPS